MEITITELMLFAWAIIATGMAFKYHEDEQKSRMFLKLLIENVDARNKMIEAFEDFKKREARNGS